jgi:hypothetical protein
MELIGCQNDAAPKSRASRAIFLTIPGSAFQAGAGKPHLADNRASLDISINI